MQCGHLILNEGCVAAQFVLQRQQDTLQYTQYMLLGFGTEFKVRRQNALENTTVLV